jgi:hypothetical protein
MPKHQESLESLSPDVARFTRNLIVLFTFLDCLLCYLDFKTSWVMNILAFMSISLTIFFLINLVVDLVDSRIHVNIDYDEFAGNVAKWLFATLCSCACFHCHPDVMPLINIVLVSSILAVFSAFTALVR